MQPKMIDYRQKLAYYEQILAEFEKQHNMTTAEFQRGFDSGELGDAPEWFDWDGYAALAEEARKMLAEVGQESHEQVADQPNKTQLEEHYDGIRRID
jgi:hypothetical protein